METSELSTLLFRALGIPDAVDDKIEVAVRLLTEQLWTEPSSSMIEEKFRDDAVRLSMAEVLKMGPDALDELLMGWVSSDEFATRTEDAMNHNAGGQRVVAVLERLARAIQTWVGEHPFNLNG